MIENRKGSPLRSSPLPADFLKMVSQVFAANFDTGLKKMSELLKAETRFKAHGNVFADEVVLSVSLLTEGQMAATTVHASCDFDPKASSPTIEDLLNASVDAIGSLFAQLLVENNQTKLEQLASESLSALENVPFEWTPVQVEKRKVFLKIDKSNPELDQMADDWLKKHDPEFEKRQQEEQKETENLFVTGPKGAKKGPGPSYH